MARGTAGGQAAIRDAAIRLFGSQGYENASMRELAALAGCSPANLYHHYRSKYDLFVTLVGELMELHLAGLRQALDQVIAALSACTRVESWYRPDGELPGHEVARRVTDFLLAGFGAGRPRAGDR